MPAGTVCYLVHDMSAYAPDLAFMHRTPDVESKLTLFPGTFSCCRSDRGRREGGGQTVTCSTESIPIKLEPIELMKSVVDTTSFGRRLVPNTCVN